MRKRQSCLQLSNTAVEKDIQQPRGALAVLESSIMTLLYRLGMREGNFDIKMGFPEFSEGDGMLGHQRSSGDISLAETNWLCLS